MNSRNRRRNRQASVKARLGIAAAVLAGGGAAGVAVAASHNAGPSSTEASSAGYIMSIHHHISVQDALSSALSTWGRSASSHQRALNTLAQMAPMQNYTQVWGPRHTRWAHTQFVAQRGVVVAVGTIRGKQFLVVRSANGGLKLWWLNANTGFVNTAANSTALVAMTGDNKSAVQAAVNNNTAPAMQQMAGSMANAAKAAAGGFSFSGTITINGQTFTFSFSSSTGTGTVSPSGMPSGTTMASATPSTTASGTTMASATPSTTASGTTMASASATPTTSATMPTTLQGLVKGDLVLVTGVRQHGQLVAQLVLLLKPATVTPNPSTSSSMTVTPATGTATTPAASTSPTHF
jgi:hypothetical protein